MNDMRSKLKCIFVSPTVSNEAYGVNPNNKIEPLEVSEMSARQSEYQIEFKTSDPSLLINLFGNELPDEGSEFSLDPDVTIKARQVEVQHGLVETSIIVNCVLKVIGGITIKVVGDLLVDRLKGRKAELSINNQKIEKLRSSEIVSALNGAKDVKK